MGKLQKKQVEEVIGYLQTGQPIPDNFKNILFPPERREYELVYDGKDREEDIIADTWGVPLQKVKTFNIPKSSPIPGWTNWLVFGDNLQVMKRMLDDPQVKGQVKLVYIDPPFATKQDFQGSQDQKAYQDKIAGAKFVEFLRKRLIFLRELLASDGVIYVHLDWRKCHYIKTVLDEIFGEANFQNEIIWQRLSARSDAKTYNHIHDVIYFYSKTQAFPFNSQYSEYTEKYIKKFYRYRDSDGRLFSIGDLTARGLRNGESGKVWRGIDPAKLGNHWKVKISTLEQIDKEGKIYWPPKGKVPRLKQYLDERMGRPLQSIWPDISPVQFASLENTKYPTQKPEMLLERIIKSSSNEGDIVLDAFAGSGTTCAVAEKLNRRWIGIDCGKFAVYTIQKRILNLHEETGNKGKILHAKPFTLYNAGLYDFKRMSELPFEDYRAFAMQLFQVRDNRHSLAGIELDGYKGEYDALIFNFKKQPDVVLDEGYIKSLHQYLSSRARSEFYIIAPASRVTFLEDYIDHGNTRYYVLRIPYSIIDELHDRPFQEIQQPVDEGDVNNTVEAVGFDFVIPPEAKLTYTMERKPGELLTLATITIKKFKSQAITKRPRIFQNRETISMVMVDYDYKGNGEGVFDLDVAFYRDEIEKDGWKVRLDQSQFGEKIMIIYMDIFGNELREVKIPADFGIRPKVKSVQKKATRGHVVKKGK